MNHEARTTLVILFSLTACVLPDSKLGDGADLMASSEDSESSATDPGPSTVTVTSGQQPRSGAIGEPCDHDTVPGYVPESRLLTYPDSACEGQLCLYADTYVAPAGTCASDLECNATDPGVQRFVCNIAESRCELSPTWFAERSMCTGFCEEDADCASEASTTCQTGFSCAPASSLGEACCRPVCICNDELDEAGTNQLTEQCMAGIPEACCDVFPGNGLCPG